jgi:PleD family two-component response regulator
VLTEAGFEVRAVGSLRTFQTVLASWRPHLIVTDLYMPEMNGAELCQWLRRQVATARIPIVLCSSAPDQELALVARAVGADAYISKVDGLDALPERLNTLCNEILW